ncbi:hypothetical protein SMA90_33535, partial [Escherichia coli]
DLAVQREVQTRGTMLHPARDGGRRPAEVRLRFQLRAVLAEGAARQLPARAEYIMRLRRIGR